ncbi:hypothetical protein [Moheibacter sediminis]|uniref:Uncharacterized protein n=1 Tax=Moheibacter sediminis TaxID=1434700 RepID=A0A1W1ZKZ3_9FLAO|nr:hypothetical protein [Moheibacter sediminis]SMC48721.1 hypothetical protein SAMN06296427_1038 [Moheibacter sediminis]
MTIEELDKNLKEIGVSESKYYLQGLYGSTNDEDKIALVIKRGKCSIEYEIYYKERGEKNSLKIFTNETEACEYVYKRLIDNKKIEDSIFRKN